MPVEEQVVSIWSGSRGHLDDVPVADVLRFEEEFLQHLRLNNIALPDILESGVIHDEVEEALVREVTNFKKSFLADGKDGIQPGKIGRASCRERVESEWL